MGDVRADLLANDGEDTVVVEHRGHQVEVRPPTLAQQRMLVQQAKDRKTGEVDGARMMALAVIACTYHPGSETRVFETADEAALMNKSTDPRNIVGKVSRVLKRMMDERPEDIEANFGAAPSDR